MTGDDQRADAEQSPPRSNPVRLGPSQASAVAAAKDAIARRRLRDCKFPAALFNDPSWDLLLDLFVADREARLVSVSSACVSAAAPISTALRHMKKLERGGHVVRCGDPLDARRNFVRLSPTARAKMVALFSAPPHVPCDQVD